MRECNNTPMPSCLECQDERYVLNGCCSGRECGCMGAPVSLSNCIKCNPKGDKDPGDTVKSWMEHVEYIPIEDKE